jgi:drug/metabolite transporter (DMT)-like permease
MNFIIYPLLFGISLALFKTLDLWYSKRKTKPKDKDWRFSPHLIWILFIVGLIMGCIYVLLFK